MYFTFIYILLINLKNDKASQTKIQMHLEKVQVKVNLIYN